MYLGKYILIKYVLKLLKTTNNCEKTKKGTFHVSSSTIW